MTSSPVSRRRERKHDLEMADSVRTLQERFALTCEAIDGVIYDWDAKRQTVIRSSGLYGLVGFHPEDVPPEIEWWDERIHPEDLVRIRETFAASQTHFQAEYRIRHRNGQYIHVWDQALIIRDAAGNIERVVGSNLDITKRKRVEEVLDAAYRAEREARQRAEHTTEQLGRLQSVTTAFSQAVTRSEVSDCIVAELFEYLAAKSVVLFIAAQDAAHLELASSRGISPESVGRLTKLALQASLPCCESFRRLSPVIADPEDFARSLYPDHERLFTHLPSGREFSFPLLLNEKALGVLRVEFPTLRQLSPDENQYIRITVQQCAQALERARLFDSERRAREQAEAANRAKDEFFATVSHELRSPLQSILGWIRLARTSKLDAQASARALEVMERNTRAQVQLVSDMLEASRIITGKISMTTEQLSIATVLEGALDSVRPTALHKGVQLVLDAPAGIPMLWGDSNRLQQVFWNLLSNAVKFTPQGGMITVKAQPRSSFLEVSVADTGEGIAPEFLPSVFERLSQGDESSTRLHGGLGLGLAIVRHLVELHGGSVRAESPGPGRGATFSVLLPYRSSNSGDVRHRATHGTQQGARPLRETLEKASQSLRGLRALVVEDGNDTRDFLVTVLEYAGAEVQSAGSVGEALQIITAQTPHILLSDIGLPGEDGYALIKRVREQFDEATVPAIALTAFARPEDRLRATAAGFQLHICKPVEPDELIGAILTLVKRNVTSPKKALR